MSGNERESPTRGIGYEPWKSMTDLCKEMWRSDYGEDIPEEVLRTVMKLTTAILEAQAARCRAEMAAMFTGSHCFEASTRKREQINGKTTIPHAAPAMRSDSHDAQVKGSQNGTDCPRVLPVLAIQQILDTLKLKKRWYRQFEAETSEFNIEEYHDPGETQKEADDSEYTVNDRKKKKAVRFLNGPPEVIDSEFTNTNEGAELLSISIRNVNAAKNSVKQRKLTFHEELYQEEEKTQEAKRKTTVDNAETRKRKSEDDSNADAKVVDEKKKKLEALHPKKMLSKLSLKKKAHQSRQNVSLGAKDVFADISIENIGFTAEDVDAYAIINDTEPPTVGPSRLVPHTEDNRMTDEQAVSTEEIDEDEEMTHASTPQYNITQHITSPTQLDSSDSINSINYIDTSYDRMVAKWLLNYSATSTSSPSVAPASNGNVASSSLSFVRSPYYIDGTTGEEIPFDPLLSMTTELPATAIKILPPWPSMHGQQPESLPINVVGGNDIDYGSSHLASPQAKDKDADKPNN